MKKPVANRYRLFISSVQKELAAERRAVKDFISHDPLLSRFISDVFLFEDIPAGDRKPDDIYLDEVEQCDIYLAILGNKYGWKNEAGTGTTDMIADCRDAGLPEPDFEQHGPHFVVTVWRDWLTDEVLKKFDLNDRQKQAITYLKTHGKISNTDYQQVANCIKKTATRDLSNLKEKGIIKQIGGRGPGVHYVITKNRDKMGTMGT